MIPVHCAIKEAIEQAQADSCNSYRTIAAWLNDIGHVTARGKSYSAMTVKRLM